MINLSAYFNIFEEMKPFILHYFRHLENSPSKYGVHVSSFLSGETWEDYLKRMKKPGEWGDRSLPFLALYSLLANTVHLYYTVVNDL